MKVSNIFVATSSLWLIVSFWNRNEIPTDINFTAQIEAEPVQKKTRKKAFSVTYEGVEYRVQPQYEYDLYGMIVSYRHHDGNSRMHMQSNDHLNMLDVCVVWGENATGDHLRKLQYWNGIFTCNVKTRDSAAWAAFNMNQLSNNHLLSDDPFIRDQVTNVQIGDQIRVRGWLSSYGSEGGGKRGTSTTRTDTGDGACETIFVDRFDIVRPALSLWRRSMYGSVVVVLIGLFWHFRRPYQPYSGAAV